MEIKFQNYVCNRIPKITLELKFMTFIMRGDLLRSVPSPKWVAKIKLICTAGCCGWFEKIYNHHLQYWQLQVLFGFEKKVRWLSNFLCHTITFSFLGFTISFHPFKPSKCILTFTNVILNNLVYQDSISFHK